MSEAGFIVNHWHYILFIEQSALHYYEVTDGKTSCGWYDSHLFKRLDDMREERLEEIGI